MAKTTGRVSANIRMLYMDDVLVGCATTNGMSGTNEQIPTTCKDGTNPPPVTYEAGAQDATFNGDFIVRFDDANQYSAMSAAFVGATEHTWKLATTNTDDPYWQFDGKITSFTETAGINTPLTFSVTISKTSALYLFNT